jgi:hypothetical protein
LASDRPSDLAKRSAKAFSVGVVRNWTIASRRSPFVTGLPPTFGFPALALL